jgi:hypothetical protein
MTPPDYFSKLIGIAPTWKKASLGDASKSIAISLLLPDHTVLKFRRQLFIGEANPSNVRRWCKELRATE